MKIYVNSQSVLEETGDERRPFRSIFEAANIAQAGDEIIVAPGIYREDVNPTHGGLDDNRRIVYRSSEKFGAVITGAEVIKNWEYYHTDTYVTRIPNSFFGSYNPYMTVIKGDWYYAEKPIHTGDVYLNGKAMYETQSLHETLNPQIRKTSWEPKFSKYTWYTQQEDNATLIYANFQGADPRNENVEINVRRHCFCPGKTGVNYITVSGFTIRQAATNWAPPTACQEGMIGPHWAKGWIIEECDISNSRCSGISLGKYLQPENENKWSTQYYKHGTQTERDAICQAQNEGWSKERVGSHVIRSCNIHDCGQAGIVGHLGGVFSLIESNHIHHINNRQDLAGAEIGGIKMHAAIDVIFRRNHIHHCTRGIWLDWQAQGSRITQNLLHDNVPPVGVEASGLSLGEDIFVEMSHGPTIIDNNLLLSAHACRLSTQGIALIHNLIAGSFTYVGNGTDNWAVNFATPRYTPYHLHHRTEIAGFMTILHGDARFYNNIFVQQPAREDLVQKEEDTLHHENLLCGTKPYDGYPTKEEYSSWFTPESVNDASDKYYDHLPVYTSGNVYFNGAQPCDKEYDAVIDTTNTVTLTLSEQNGSCHLHTNLYNVLPKVRTKLVTTQSLGLAFEPEQPFENPDGTPIVFNRDFFDASRSVHPTPGPFEDGNECREPLLRGKGNLNSFPHT